MTNTTKKATAITSAVAALGLAAYSLIVPLKAADRDLYVCCDDDNDCSYYHLSCISYYYPDADCQAYPHIGGGHYFCLS